MKHALPILLLLASCATVTTAEEREFALTAIETVQTAIDLAVVTGKLSEADHTLAKQDLAALRALVAESETKPVSAVRILQIATQISVRWLGRDVTTP